MNQQKLMTITLFVRREKVTKNIKIMPHVPADKYVRGEKKCNSWSLLLWSNDDSDGSATILSYKNWV